MMTPAYNLHVIVLNICSTTKAHFYEKKSPIHCFMRDVCNVYFLPSAKHFSET